MTPEERAAIVARYREHAQRFEGLAASRRATALEGSPAPIPAAEREPGDRIGMPSARELAVVKLVADGLQNTEIAELLYVTEETVKTHIKNILAKLRARNRAHVVAIAFRRGLLDRAEPAQEHGPRRQADAA